jgi:hypothetical protein
VHPTLGILARFQAFFYASAFSQSDGVPPPAPARVTQTVGRLVNKAYARKGLQSSLYSLTTFAEQKSQKKSGVTLNKKVIYDLARYG